MSDERLRELERRFKESGRADDEAAWLAELLRTGGLARETLIACAILQHEAARTALGGEDSEELWFKYVSPRSIFEQIAKVDITLPIRATTRAARHLLDMVPKIPEIERLKAFVCAQDQSILDPEGSTYSLIQARTNLLGPDDRQQLRSGKQAHFAFTCLSSRVFLGPTGDGLLHLNPLAGAFDELALALRAHKPRQFNKKIHAEIELKRVAFSEVVRYVLGYGDDLGARVEARE